VLTCREIDQFLMAYLAEELLRPQRTLFEQHLAGCTDCRNYLHSYRQTLAASRSAFPDPDAKPPPSVPEQLIQAILRSRPSTP
jgi:anti-sigma factor RsiW